MLFWKDARNAGAGSAASLARRLPDPLPSDPGAYLSFRDNDAQLKAWLPEGVWAALAEVADLQGVPRPSLVRAMLFSHVYGTLDLHRMREARDGLFFQVAAEPVEAARAVPTQTEVEEPMFSRRRNDTPELGKSTRELLLSLPGRLLADLGALAARADTPLSSFVREILVRAVLGRHYFPDA